MTTEYMVRKANRNAFGEYEYGRSTLRGFGLDICHRLIASRYSRREDALELKRLLEDHFDEYKFLLVKVKVRAT